MISHISELLKDACMEHCTHCFHLATLLLVLVLDVSGHYLSSYQVSFPFVNSAGSEYSGILQTEADVLTHYI
jgi:hypothetical protein